jgi:rsbT co-antagonist protein RsbR
MPVPEQLDDTIIQQQRLRFLMGCGIAIMLLFTVNSLVELANRAGLVEILSAAADISFTLFLIGLYVLLSRMQLATAAMLIGAAILIYCTLNILLFPDALMRAISQPLLAVVVAVAYVESRRLRILSVAAWLTAVLVVLLSNGALLSIAPVVDVVALCAANAIILLVLNVFHARMTESLAQTRTANAALRDSQATLEGQVAERTASLQQALDDLQIRAEEQARLLDETAQQRATIRSLSLPVLPVNGSTLAIPLVGALDSDRLRDLQEQTLRAIERTGARRLVLDITGVPAVDAEVAQGILQVAQAVQLMGARVVLAGIRPEVAQALVSLDADLDGLETAATLQEGIDGASDITTAAR